MMLERLIRILEENEGVNDWKIEQIRTVSRELFYVGKELETSRRADTTACEATVYTDREGFRGSARFTVYPHMSDRELREKVEANVYAASFVKNPFFPLPESENADLPKSDSNLKEGGSQVMEDLVRAVFAADLYENGSLSASEFFLTEQTVRVLNSRGVDLTDTAWSGSVEIIPSWEQGTEAAEVYHMLKFESLDPDEITREVQEQVDLVRERSAALKLTGTADIRDLKVILQDEEAGALLKAFGEDLSYAAKYNKVNHTEIGEDVQKGKTGKVTGTRLNLWRVPYVPNCTASASFDRDGVVLKEICLIRDGIALNRFGDYQNGSWLGVEKPTGRIPVTVVEAGSRSFAEMSRERYVRCVKWSGIQIDLNSGYFGGEVRFGYYFDGEKEIPVTGFTVSGNLEEAKETFLLSSETIRRRDYAGPKYIEIRGMDIV